MITVFTPTYNRAYIIGQLYRSLCEQTSNDFEWLIVDDGSTDSTETTIRSFIEEDKIAIRYIKQPNGGKHRAINRGVNKAAGELFFIVDSDDHLAADAIEKLSVHYDKIASDKNFAGISGVRIDKSGKRIGGEFPFESIDCTALDIRLKYGIKGDLAEAYKTDVLKRNPFPTFDGEKFCPEALVWNRIAADGLKLRYTAEPIYICEYIADGLTAKITRIRMESPKASLLHYAELYGYDIPFLAKIKAAVNFWRFAPCGKGRFSDLVKQIGRSTIPLLPTGYLFHLKDKIRQ